MSNEAQNGNFAKPMLSAVVKTHLVIDVIYNDAVFAGTKTECEDWKSEQGFGYRVVPMTKDELSAHNYL
jgi:hypothetical protein